MRTFLPRPLIAVAVALLFAACGKTAESGEGTTSRATGKLALTGQTDLRSFPAGVSGVELLKGSAVVATAPLAADGRFALTVPAGSGYRLRIAYGPGKRATLVFPRKAGTVDLRFSVAGSGGFDLGLVRYIGDPSTHAFAFHTTKQGALSSEDAAAKQGDRDDGDLNCENGVDPNTGAVCVDDDEGDEDLVCEAGEGESEQDDGDLNCEDGIDPATGAYCDGGPAANQDDGSEEGESEGESSMPAEAAVADHNLPASTDCARSEDAKGQGEQDGDDVNCEDGTDPATGLPCDGGPAANQDDGQEER